MTDDQKTQKADKLQILIAEFGAQLPEKLTAARQLWTALQAQPSDALQRDELYQLIHTLAGSAGTFGYRRFGTCARQLEYMLLEKKETAYSDPEVINTIDNMLTQLEILATQDAH